MKLLVLIFAFTFSIRSFSATVSSSEVVLLVPGFFNSFTAEYFSDTIVNTFKARGFSVYVATGLNPVGTVEDNGSRLIKIMDRIQKTEGRNVDFNVVAHSAGGLYTLFVADKHLFRIKNLISISTPYKGVEFLDEWRKDCSVFKALTDLAPLEGLAQLTPEGVSKFLDTIRVGPEMKITAFGGTQKSRLDIWDARNFSLPFVVTSRYISENTDGIVGFSSAMGLGQIKTTEGTIAVQRRDPNFTLNLDHWEQVLDGYSFLILGVRNPWYINNEQQRFYNGIADYLMTLL